MTPRTPAFAKHFVWLCGACVLIFFVAIMHPVEGPIYTNISDIINITTPTELPLGPPAPPTVPSLAHEDLKYILQWTPSSNSPFAEMSRGRSVFLDNDCEYTNCYVTDDRDYFIYMSDFDVILFHVKDALGLKATQLPKVRLPSQKYLFVMMESSHYYPVCGNQWNGFFNWTWTYRLDSDIPLEYISFYDKLEPRKRLGPKADIDWSHLESQFDEELSQNDVERLKSKKKAAAWFVSNCHSKSKREDFAKQLKGELLKYDMVLDVYGPCGTLKCSRKIEDQCKKRLETDYFFYLSFENSFAEDYVTEKLFTALDHLTVPVVYGGANYSRFLPPSSYLNALELGPAETAKRMHDLISDPVQYRRMLRWRSRLEYRLTWQHEDMCALCAALNNETRLKAVSIIEDLPKWWNPSPDTCGTKSKP